MGMRLNQTIVGVTTAVFSTLATSAAIAQTATIPYIPIVGEGTIPQKFEEEYYTHDENFFENRTIPRQVNAWFGPAGFVDNEIGWDSKRVNELYQEVLGRQLSSGPILRTTDLPNPFNLSLETIPRYTAQPVPPPFPTIERLPVRTSPPPSGPVPALW
jgi:hypothetical protein